MSRYPPGCESLIGGHLLLLDSSRSLRRRRGYVYRGWHSMGSWTYVSVFLVQGLSQMLGTSYYGPPCRTSAPATAPRTEVGRMPMMTVGMTRMGCRTHHLALPTKIQSKIHSFVTQFSCVLYLLTVRSLSKRTETKPTENQVRSTHSFREPLIRFAFTLDFFTFRK